MFSRKECSKCGKKVSDKSNYCSSCGGFLGKSEEDFGMLGKDDGVMPINNSNPFESMLGGFGGNMLGKMLGNAMKMLEKEMQKEMRSNNSGQFPLGTPKTNFELFVNGKKVDPSKIKISQGQMQYPLSQGGVKKFVSKHFSKQQQEKFSKFKQEEPKTNVKRFSDRIVYEIEVPGVESVKDTSIVKFENSIEIRAISKDKAYFKVFSINLPIIAYELLNDKLILELETKD